MNLTQKRKIIQNVLLHHLETPSVSTEELAHEIACALHNAEVEEARTQKKTAAR